MKSGRRIGWCLSVFVTGLLGCSSQTHSNSSSHPSGTPAERYVRDIEPILRRKCFDCHHSGREAPWYAAIPIAGEMIRRDIRWGRQRLDLKNPYPFVDSDEIGEAAYLIALRTALLDDTMPPTAYLITHPFSRVPAAERDLLLAWIEDAIESLAIVRRVAVRHERGATPTASPEEPEEPEQPEELLLRGVTELVRNRCARCHRESVDKEMNAAFDYITDLVYLTDDDYVFPGNLEESLLYQKIAESRDPMPPSPNDRLSAEQIAMVREWIEIGAPTH